MSCFADGNGLVSLYKDRKVRLCGKLGISSRSLRRSIVDADYLWCRVSAGVK